MAPRIAGTSRIDRDLQTIFEAWPQALIVADSSGRVVLANARAQALFGRTVADMTATSIHTLLGAGLRASHIPCFGPKPRPGHVLLNVSGVKGEEFPAEISAVPLRRKGRALVTFSVAVVAHRVNVDLEAQQATRVKNEFLANMSHELRTPLNAIIGFADLIRQGRAGQILPQQEEYLGDILSSARTLLQIVNDVLDLSKIESGRLRLKPQPVDLPKLVQEVRDVVRGSAAAKGVSLELRLEKGLSTAMLDAVRFKQIVYNYLSNAIKFTPAGGRVLVRTVLEGDDCVRVEVEDTGIGIALEEIPRLFVEFQQLNGGTTKKYAGGGLGLALTKRLAEAMGGRVEARSHLGKGSVFTAIIPRGLNKEPVHA